ncbi:MAG: InlB B-repeat-containing protein [Treponema sp.]|nr:InlB B-repeat-containing protein [Treponema sp.]
MKKFFRKTMLLAFAAVLSYGFMSCSDSGDEGNYWSETATTNSSSSSSTTTTTTYTITFNANDGSGTVATQTLKAGEKLSTCTFTAPDGKEFLGWSTSSTATSASYGDGATFTPTSGMSTSVTLYAVWVTKGEVSYKVSHRRQKAKDSIWYDEYECELKSGTAGATTAAVAKDYTPNYTAQDFSQSTIASDGSTVVIIKYTLVQEISTGVSVSVGTASDITLTKSYGATSDDYLFTASGAYVNEITAYLTANSGSNASTYYTWVIDGTPITDANAATYGATIATNGTSLTLNLATATAISYGTHEVVVTIETLVGTTDDNGDRSAHCYFTR